MRNLVFVRRGSGLSGTRRSGRAFAIVVLAGIVASIGRADPPPASTGPEALVRASEAYRSSLQDLLVEVNRIDDLMQHRSPCPECGQGGGGLTHPHSPADAWKRGDPYPSDAIRAEWERRLGIFFRKSNELRKIRVTGEEVAKTLGPAAPADTARRIASMRLAEFAVDRLARAMQRRDLDEYQASLNAFRSVVSMSAPPPDPGTKPPAAPAGGPVSPKPVREPKMPTAEEIARKQAAVRTAIGKHAAALAGLRPLVDRFDDLINHRKNCPECGGGGGREHPHAVFRAWRDTGDFNADRMRQESKRVQRDIGRLVSEAQAATRLVERIVEDLGGADSAAFAKDLAFMRSVAEPLDGYDTTLNRNKWESYDAALAAVKAALSSRAR